ncbi:EamA family transporter RarD [Actibacterium ureilyticum]|uniref:EamA family transporter RarD n=1 Tax=Actibacterium ureilyticum TaxID=1590614 RepID=UPI000BAAFFA4|nr:EamA family transporter RarD [Actibacterium ureilyticum]
MTEARKGVLAMAAASVIWGLSSIYYKLLAHVPPLEVLCHRTLWSLLLFALVLMVQGRLGQVAALLRDRREALRVALAATMISVNWGMFIYSVQVGHAVEASLGYYIFPLVAVLMGFVVLGEGLSRRKWLAVGLATLAVCVLTAGLGVPPWISLALAVTFGFYGLIKQGLGAGPVVSVTTEVALLAPLALVWLWGVHTQGWTGLVGRNLGAFGSNWHDTLMLAGSGLLTGGPLILFSYASKRVSMASIGLVQYINPTLQFLVASLIFVEPVTRWHMVALPLIWGALAIYSWDSLRQERRSRKAAISVGTSSTV